MMNSVGIYLHYCLPARTGAGVESVEGKMLKVDTGVMPMTVQIRLAQYYLPKDRPSIVSLPVPPLLVATLTRPPPPPPPAMEPVHHGHWVSFSSDSRYPTAALAPRRHGGRYRPLRWAYTHSITCRSPVGGGGRFYRSAVSKTSQSPRGQKKVGIFNSRYYLVCVWTNVMPSLCVFLKRGKFLSCKNVPPHCRHRKPRTVWPGRDRSVTGDARATHHFHVSAIFALGYCASDTLHPA